LLLKPKLCAANHNFCFFRKILMVRVAERFCEHRGFGPVVEIAARSLEPFQPFPDDAIKNRYNGYAFYPDR
jgi:hypothetical protein